MPQIKNIFLENRAWVKEKLMANPHFFSELAKDQNPVYLWIGCSDSRALPNEITGTSVGDIFTHRNIANLVNKDDLNLECVVTYALKYLKVQQVIICGHYGCGGVRCATLSDSFGVIDRWLLNIKSVVTESQKELDLISNPNEKFNRLVELNTIKQVDHFVSLYGHLREHLPELHVHGWVYDMTTGLIKDLVRKTL